MTSDDAVTITATVDESGAGSCVDSAQLPLAKPDRRQRALHDDLTGLPNRASFLEQLQRALTYSRLPGRGPVAVLSADIDQFELVNDTWGHSTGDLLLVEIAKRLVGVAGAARAVARFGGDEFALTYEDCDDAQARNVANAFLVALARPFELKGQRVHVTASVGIATTAQGDTATAEELLRFADVALHDAKAHAHGQIRSFELALAERASQRLLLGIDLREALIRDELDLHYQPVVDLSTGRLRGVEALARWQHPLRGSVSPVDFVPVAESAGLATALDRWALGRACRDLAQMRRHLGSECKVSVNISARHLVGTNLEACVASALHDSGLPATALALEITESAVMDDPDHAYGLLARLEARGVGVAIDDFGTGYSSLAHLARLPAATLKIDRSFIEHMVEDEDSFAIAAVIVDLGRAMRMTTVAEGVETREQMLLLRHLGCTAGQGYLWSPPLSASRLIEVMEALPRRRFDVHEGRCALVGERP